MEKVIKFLQENSILFLATIGLDGKPKVRPFQFMLENEGKLYFCTSNQKKIYSELKNNPYVELSTSSKNFAWIRINGKVNFDNSLKLKNKIIENNSLVKSIYQSGDNPNFEIFYLDNGLIEINDFSQNPSFTIKI
ncbi:pyridoxamine 5'-phosphate oxidase family protein [uncultured Fusobacterium sp.]|uniref:pyridoxamine 5'-phosphate oxidase family protein n=1 Tax=uncultured Fusobacterium sp. TaxID=159267 RepID=UPI0025EAB537|nr:pyridoxamine 5'-phosphate oxidase family protein [uncultured Fusobacterium sp.]